MPDTEYGVYEKYPARPGKLSPDQIRSIRKMWNAKTLSEIASEIDASFEAVCHFAKTHYLYFNYIR